MKTEQKIKLYTKLLEITAESRFEIMKKIWNLHLTSRPQSHIHYRDALSDALTDLRQDIFKTLISDEALSSAEFVMGIVSCSDLPQVKKNIAIMVIAGLEEGCIADMNCVSKGFVMMYNRTLREDFPEIFAEM